MTHRLFDDAWTNEHAKGSLLQEMKKLGFERVDLKSGQGYHVHFDLKG